MVELAQPFGEHCAANSNSVPPLTFMDRVIQEGIRIDCIGVQLLFGQGSAGRASRDLMQISDLIDRYLVLEMPVVISAFGVPNHTIDEAGRLQGVDAETDEVVLDADFARIEDVAPQLGEERLERCARRNSSGGGTATISRRSR